MNFTGQMPQLGWYPLVWQLGVPAPTYALSRLCGEVGKLNELPSCVTPTCCFRLTVAAPAHIVTVSRAAEILGENETL
ncbi:MAG: hypothetical protein WAK69_03965 [Rhodoplanes sp.]